MADIVYEQRIELPYVYTAGAVQRGALQGLSEGKLVASSGEGWVNAPAAPFGPAGQHLHELVELPAEGVLLARTTAHHRPGAPVLALIRIDGTSNALLHRLAGGAEQLPLGSRVRAEWASQRTGSILDIAHFAPSEEDSGR